MSVIKQVDLKVEHGPYWLRLFEMADGVFMNQYCIQQTDRELMHWHERH